MALTCKPFGDIITFTRASTGTYFDSAGVLQSAAIDAPRFDYNPATLAAQGLLIEEQRTNSLLQSGWAGAVGGSPGAAPTSWNLGTVAGTPTTTLTTSIYGASEQAVLFTGVTNDRLWYQQSINVTAGVTYTASVFCEVVTGTPRDVLEIVNGTATRTIITRVTNNPTSGSRATIVFSADTTGNLVIRIGIGTTFGITANGTAQLSRPQVEAGAFPTSYIPTTTTALTRSADVASVNTLSPWYNQTEGTVYAELQSLSPLTGAQSVALNKYPHVWQIEAGASDSTLWCYGLNSELYIATTFNNIGAVPSGINKIAVALAASGGQSRSSLNGAAAVNRNGTLTGTATGFFLGRDSTAGVNNFLNGYLRRLTYYPRALSAAELPVLTA